MTALRATVEPDREGQGGEPGERKLPNSQMHELRAALFLGHDVADGRLRQLMPRFEHRGLGVFVPRDDRGEISEVTLFWRPTPPTPPTPPAKPEPLVTGLLDAMDAVEFLGDAEVMTP